MPRSLFTNRFGRSALSALILATAAPTAGAQVAGIRPLSPGTRVRVTSSALEPQRQVVTTLVQRPDTLVFSTQGKQDSIALPLASVSRLEVSAGKHTRVRKGIVVGTLSGAAIGAVASYASYKKPECSNPFGCGDFLNIESRSTETALGALGGAILGGVLGGVVGAVWRPERWQNVPIPGRGASLRVVPAYQGLALSAAF